MGFKINPYIPCVSNKMVNENQMTVCWHVNNLKMIHIDKNAVSIFALKLAKIYRPKTTISRGKVYEYLGLGIDWKSVPGSIFVHD